MILGIISKPEHCQSHERGLRHDGHDVRVLGGDAGFTVPSAVKVIVLRTQSCSHGASDQAFRWGREPGNLLVVENGLTGIRRKLEDLKDLVEVAPVKPRRSAHSSPTRDPFASLGLERFFPLDPPKASTPPVQEVLAPIPAPQEISPIMQDAFSFPTDFPELAAWALAVPLPRLRREILAAWDVYLELSPGMRQEIADAVKSIYQKDLGLGDGERFFRVICGRHAQVSTLKRQPLRFLGVVLLCLDPAGSYKAAHLADAYYVFNDEKATNLHTVVAAAWATKRTVEISPFTPRSHKVEAARQAARVAREENTPRPVPLDAVVGPATPLPVETPKVEGYSIVGQMAEQPTALTQQVQNTNKLLEQALERIKYLESANILFSRRLEGLELDASAKVEETPVAPWSSDQTLKVIDALRSRGADITISFKA